MTGPAQFPVVASFGTMAGPSDSTFVMLALSVPNSALRFQRDGGGFFAEYTINLTFMNADSVPVKRFETRELVRVPTFAETGRTDESVVYQRAIAVQPGSYIMRLQAADANSSRGFRMTDTLTVPAYGTRSSIASPLLVYEANGRRERSERPDLISNPRHTVPYGGEAPLLYVEAYGEAAAEPLSVSVLDAAGTTLWNGRTELRGDAGAVRYGIVEIPAANLPLGRFVVEVGGAGAATTRTPLVLTISDQWMVANFDEVLQFLRYIAYPAELDSLRTGTPAEQRAAWERFWERRDPLPITDINEYRDDFFARVRYATEAFREPGGRGGWDTDRGEVYIVLGPPDHAIERYIGQVDIAGRPNAQEWLYSTVPGGRLNLLFHDRTGFGRYELVPTSQSAFRAVADQLRRRR
ncbi:MAG TPA: GWxTD domain-containing protein [Longimicrobiales bacterium]|nr:GWxTD domain-containing protein [Longimicrobiales bacterium]